MDGKIHTTEHLNRAHEDSFYIIKLTNAINECVIGGVKLDEEDILNMLFH